LLAGLRMVIIMSGVVLPVALDRNRQLSREVSIPRQELCERRTTFLAGIPGLEKCRDAINPARHIHAATGGEYDNRILVGGSDLTDELILTWRKAELAVTTFTFGIGIKAYRQHHGVRARCQCFCFGPDYSFRAHNAEVGSGLTPAAVDIVIQFDLMRTRCEMKRNFTYERIPLFPVVDNELLVDI